MDYAVKDMGLAPQGKRNIALAEGQMAALMKVRERFASERPFEGLRIGMALHVTKETAVLVKTLMAGGAEVAIAGCNPLSTQDDIAAALVEDGVRVYGFKGESSEEYYGFIKKIIEFEPHITIDDGCDLVSEIHKNHTGLLEKLVGGCEETTTGVVRLQAMQRDGALKYPVVAVNNNLTKHLMDNYYGTGQSTLDGVMRACNFMFAGKTAVVAGYGACGKGIAKRLQGMGAKVIVTEVKPFVALQAVMDGFQVMPMVEAAPLSDLFLTVTGNKDVITVEHMKMMKSGAILANSGHFDCEIDVKGLASAASAVERVRPSMDEYILDGKKIYILGEGRLVNLAAAEGHPGEVMSLSFCGQAMACEYLVKNRGKLEAGVHVLPEEIDVMISGLQLDAMGVKIDKLTPEQEAYLADWEEGT